jgi:hypothetical protein
MQAVVEVYRARRDARYSDKPRWNWRLWLAGKRHATGPGFDTIIEAAQAARQLHEVIRNSRLVLPSDEMRQERAKDRSAVGTGR